MLFLIENILFTLLTSRSFSTSLFLISIQLACIIHHACIIHNHLPIAMLNGFINTRLKDKNGDLSSSDNYREIMISNNMFKVFEYVLLDRIKSVIAINDSQFGCREGTSTLMAIALFKETISKYISEVSFTPVS